MPDLTKGADTATSPTAMFDTDPDAKNAMDNYDDSNQKQQSFNAEDVEKIAQVALLL
ncbi:MAG: hypothetical protein Q8M03_15065 [Legionella sp.]|nr:hypothetical protein [Legionella sp.]